MDTLVILASTILRFADHICSHHAEEIAVSNCQTGCKVYRCKVCRCKSTIHNPWYGCRINVTTTGR